MLLLSDYQHAFCFGEMVFVLDERNCHADMVIAENDNINGEFL